MEPEPLIMPGTSGAYFSPPLSVLEDLWGKDPATGGGEGRERERPLMAPVLS